MGEQSIVARSARRGVATMRIVVATFGSLAAVTLPMLALRENLDKAHVALLYLLVVFATSAFAGRRFGLALAGTAFLLFNFLFLKPYYTLTITDPFDWLILLFFLLTSAVAAQLLEYQRRQTVLAEERGVELDRLATLGAETLNAPRAELALAAIARVIQTAVGVDRCELYVQLDDQPLRLVADTQPLDSQPDPEPDAQGLVQYIIKTGNAAMERPDFTVHVVDMRADRRDDTRGPVRSLALPLTIRSLTLGVVRVSGQEPIQLSESQMRVLNSLAYYASLGVERFRLERTEATAEELRRLDRLKDALLAAVSHDLRTPLTTIKGIAHELSLNGATRAQDIEEEVGRLTSLVDSLLELSQLNAGALPVHVEMNTVDELIGVALDRCEIVLRNRAVHVSSDEPDLISGTFDLSHSVRIVVNLIENAVKYSPHSAPIDIASRVVGDRIEVSVADRGVGVPVGERVRIFEPFYRVPGATVDVRGAGLGLSIAQRLARAQGGDLRVEERTGGGSTFVLSLPAL